MKSTHVDKWVAAIFVVIIFAALYNSSLYSYLLFHSLAEFFSIIVAFGIFMIAWNSRGFMENNYLLFMGIAFFFIGSIDLLHTLAYKGMAVFKGYDANLPTQLWIAGRYVQSLSLLVAPFLLDLKQRLKIAPIFGVYLAVGSLLFMSIFIWETFPDCFVEGQGLTLFKKVSEYIICGILISSILILRGKRKRFEPYVYRLVVASVLFTVGAELAFTFYVGVFDLSNLIGHFFKIISFYLIYKAIIETGLVRPYDLLFRDLKKSEMALRKEKTRLQAALNEIKVLKGILPICASCKKIRTDEGYWTQIEAYIRDHSDAVFTHGICPDCSKALYPELGLEDE